VFVLDRDGRFVGATVGGGDHENLNILTLLAQAGVPVDLSKLPESATSGQVVQRRLPLLAPGGPPASASAQPPAAATAPTAPLFNPQLGRMKIGDPVPDVALLVEGSARRLADFAGRPLLMCLVFNAIPSSAYVPKMEAVAARYQAAYGLQTLVVKVNTTEGDYRDWLGTTVSFLRGWDPAGRFAPSRAELAEQEHLVWDARRLVRTLMGSGTEGSPAMPAYVVIRADGRFGGWLTGHASFDDGLANLLLHAGVPLAPEHRPKWVAPAGDFLPEIPPLTSASPVVGGAMPEIQFTDVAGRKVTLSGLRGRVVLLDFWATWCGPCVAELPALRKLYRDYHDRGLEIVGISLENAALRSSDTPEQSTEKLERAKKVLTDFIAREQMPWPQYFDGKHWKNDLSTRFGIRAIPAILLIDREGKLVSTGSRGEKLEAEVKRLLGL
jgi:thiol-disulfide isomerase/thioredoxin